MREKVEAKVDKCKYCGVVITKRNRGGNYYNDVWCKKCWLTAKKGVGRSWGGDVDDRGYNYD